MLVDIVKAVEGPEIGPIPTNVWFERFDRINSVLPHALYFSSKSGFEIFGRTRNQKSGLVTAPFRPTGSDQIQLLSKVVECAPEVIEGISSDGWNTDRDGFDVLDIIDELSRIRIALC